MRSLVVLACLAVAALALLPATDAQPLPCSLPDCHVTVTEPGRCPEAGYYDTYTVGPVTVRLLHCTSGVPP